MTKGIFKELVFLRVNGGQLADSASVDRRDVAAFMPVAINYGIMAAYNQSIQQDGLRDFPSSFYTYFPNQTILVDATRHNWKYILKPTTFVSLYKNQGIRGPETDCGEFLKPLSDNAFRTIKHYAKVLTGAAYYRPEGNKIYLFGLNPLAQTIGVPGIVDCASLADTDELPIVAGFETVALDKCFEWISGERHEPADRKDDQRDVN